MLSIITSSFREEWCKRLIDSIQNSITNQMPYEIIVVGPNKLDYKGVISIQDFGSPTRCVQIGSIVAKHKYMCWISDDCLIIENNLEKVVDCLELMPSNAQLILPYYEGENFSGNQNTHPKAYWNIHYHSTLALPGIPAHYKAAFIGAMSTDKFRELGGFDCQFDGINLSCVDLSIRVQELPYGSVMVPDMYVCNADWSYMTDAGNRGPLQAAFDENDYPLFRTRYGSQDIKITTHIDYNNWTQTPSVWPRRFAVSKK